MESITVVQQVTATLQAQDSKGNPAPLVGVPAWASSDPTILAVTPAADGMTALCVAAGKLGTATITITATPKKADGTADTAISGTAQVQVTSAEASQLVITFGTPTLQVPNPPPPPPPPAA